MRETAGSVAAPAARCKNLRRGSFIAVLLRDRLYCTRVNGRGRAMRAWIDRTNDGLSGMPADGISLPPKKGDFGTSRWAGSKLRLHQPRDWAEGGMTACGTSQTSGDVRLESAKRSPADIDQAAPTNAIHESTPSCARLPRVAAASFGLLARRSAQGKNGSN